MTHCESMPLDCFCGYKMINRKSDGLCGAANFGVGNSNMAFVIEIDTFLLIINRWWHIVIFIQD